MINKFRMVIVLGGKGEVFKEGNPGVVCYIGNIYFSIYILYKMYTKECFTYYLVGRL